MIAPKGSLRALCLALAFAIPALVSAASSAPPASAPSSSAPAASAAASFDTARIHAAYLDGDFDRAISMVEKAFKEKRVTSHADSIFAFKHLGVMYAANENSRERGKYYMLQLLMLEPTAKILDMYASDMIYMIFKNIKDEFDENQAKLERARGHVEGNRRASAPDSPAAGTTPATGSGGNGNAAGKSGKGLSPSTWYWIGGAGAAIVGAGLTFYLLQEPTTKRVTYDVQ